MNILKKLSFFYLLVLFSACSSKKDIIYLQGFDSDVFESNYSEYLISVDDILKISISSDKPELTAMLNPGGMQSSIINSKDLFIINGYQVNSEGNIIFPELGEVYVLGNTINQLRRKFYQLIVDKGIIINPTIDIKILNSHFTILGEVSMPGRYEFLKNDLNIFEAIGYAGDLTINGKRDNIKLIREDINGSKRVFSLDLTSMDILTDKNFQIFSGDIIIVDPNYTRVKNAGIIGNSGTLLSLLSFILSSLIVISN